MSWRSCLWLGIAIAGLGAEDAFALSCSSWSAYEVIDGKLVYHSGSSQTVTGLDPKTLKRLVKPSSIGSCSAGYAADAKSVIYEGRRIYGADAASIEVIGGEWSVYAKDRHRVYAEGKPISNAVGTFRAEHNGYATDGTAGFYGSKRLPGAGFSILQLHAKSDSAVFYMGEIMRGADPRTFEELKERPGYGRDSRNAYYEGRLIEGGHGPSFEIIAVTVDYARDRARVYYRGNVVAGADPATMREIKGHGFRDKRAVYLGEKEISGADPETFRLSKFGQYGMDSKRVYRLTGGVLDRDPATFEEMQPFYTRDRNGVYYQDKPMLVADPPSFQARAMNHADDKVFRYARDQVVCKHQASSPGSVPLCR